MEGQKKDILAARIAAIQTQIRQITRFQEHGFSEPARIKACRQEGLC